ncbi:DMT family transporter [Jannaschia sp. LMIT008]|uniref:DMT family transporter n=1 Tax=Jannaschia maritima TaxID=3032585 RepID=UPI0028122F84|nr:DMT family transporter [Jannaschia sp. LMIT008]
MCDAALPAGSNRRAALFMAVSTAFVAATMPLAKALGTDVLGPPLPVFMVTLGRFLFAWITIATVLAAIRPRLVRPDLPTHVMRTACGFTGVTFMFAAAAAIPLADATAISFVNPVLAMILAIPLLGERVGPWRWLAAAVALTGALVLTRPGGGVLATGALFALGAAVAYAFEVIFIKRLSGAEPPVQLLFVNNSIGLCLALVAAGLVWQSPTPGQWTALAALGVLMACAQFCFVNAMARAEASFVTPFVYLTLVFAGLYDAALFGVVPDAVSLGGAGLVLAGALLLAWREGRAKAVLRS